MGVANDYAEVVERFGAVAERYCAIVDAAAQMDKTQLLLQVYRILPELIGGAIRLPDTDPWRRNEPDDPNEPVDLGQESSRPRIDVEMEYKTWQNLYELLQEKLGDSNLYWEVFDPVKETEAIQGSLADDIAGIYRDLNDGLARGREDGAILAEVIWEWRTAFYTHWGHHAIDALRTIHSLLGDKIDDGEIV
ncbi:MAG: DUF5063 domain-containing protein [Acidobacteriia bacterium]|nr:DUF5063 domain-containing protein [Terriglobia bacterium]